MKQKIKRITIISILFFLLFLSIINVNFNVKSIGIIEQDSNISGWGYGNRELAFKSDGTLYCVYVNETNNDVMFEKSTDDGLTWTGLRNITNTGYGYYAVCIAIDSNDKIYIAFQRPNDANPDQSDVFANWSTDDGNTWDGQKLMDCANNPEGVAIVVDNDDDVYVICAYGTNNQYIRCCKYQDALDIWGSPFTVYSFYENCGSSNYINDAVAIQNDSIFIIQRRSNSCYFTQLRYFIINSDLSSSGPYMIYNSAAYHSVVSSSACTDFDDRIHIVYRRENGTVGKYGVYYKYIEDGVLSDEEEIYYNSAYAAGHPTISYTYWHNILEILYTADCAECADDTLFRYRGWTGDWTYYGQAIMGSNEITRVESLYARFPWYNVLPSGIRFAYYNNTDTNICYADSSMFLWWDGEDYNEDDPPGGGPGGGWGNGIRLNVYNESNASEELIFNVFITNYSGSETYYDEVCTNPHDLYYNQIPLGAKTSFLIGSAGYYSRQFYMDLTNLSINYEINIYLAPLSANLYSMIVIDEYNNPVENVKLTIKRYINQTGKFENMTSLYTDGAGECTAYLLPVQYLVSLNKSGYYDKTESYIPDPNYYGKGYPKYFKISRIYDEGPPIQDIYMDSLFLSTYNSSTMQVDYANLNKDNDHVNFTIYDFFNSSILYYYNVSVYPDNISFLFVHADYYLVGDILKVSADATRINGSNYVTVGYYNVNRGSNREGNAWIALILSIGICLFGLTLVHPKNVFGPIGIVIIIIALIITAFADQTWYIHLIQAIEIILLIFIMLIFREEGVHAV